MTFEYLVTSYGYWALLFGTLLEGETILVIGGFLAHRGYLSFPLVVLVSFAGSLLGDQFYFLLGRTKGQAFLVRRPSWQAKLGKVREFMLENQTLLILGFRFLYGLRSVVPFALGMSSVATRRFVPLNAVGALIWAFLIAAAGYLFGATIEVLLGYVDRIEQDLVLAIAVTGALVWMVYLFGRRKPGPR